MNRTKHRLILVLALAAFSWPASASGAQFHVSAGNATLTTNTVTTEVGIGSSSLKCAGGGLFGNGPAAGTAETQVYFPLFHPCSLAGLVATTQTNGCTYVVNANASTWSLSCPNEKGLVFNATSMFASCIFEIQPQTGINGVSFENVTPRTTFKIKFAPTNTASAVTKSTLLCPLKEGPNEGTTTAVTFTVKANEGAAEIWRE